jgi:hypothetical protein
MCTEKINDKDVELFRKSLICTLSLSSKELFHSNLIGWLLENNLDFAKRFLRLDKLTCVESVEREKSNFDLLVNADGNYYIIENKVKSLPCSEQMTGYVEKSNQQGLEATFILLSLSEPDNRFRSLHPNVRIVSYENMLTIFDNLKANSFINEMLSEYRTLLEILIKIKRTATIFPRASLLFDRDQEKLLKQIRLFDVAQKVRYSNFSNLVYKRLDDANRKGFECFIEPKEVSFSRGLAFMSLKSRFKYKEDDIFLGIQIQGDHYRLYVESCSKKDVQALAEDLKKHDLWVNPEHAANNNILKYGEYFKYCYSFIREMSANQILAQIEKDLLRLFDSRSALKSKLQIEHRNIQLES